MNKKIDEQKIRNRTKSNLDLITLYCEFHHMMTFRQVEENNIFKFIFWSIFNTEFNLSFKKRHTNTCKTCDEMKATFQSRIMSVSNKEQLEKEKREHDDRQSNKHII